MFDFLAICRIYGNLKLFPFQLLRLYFVEKIPALATQKRVDKAIHSQSTIKFAREVKIFYQRFFK